MAEVSFPDAHKVFCDVETCSSELTILRPEKDYAVRRGWERTKADGLIRCSKCVLPQMILEAAYAAGVEGEPFDA